MAKETNSSENQEARIPKRRRTRSRPALPDGVPSNGLARINEELLAEREKLGWRILDLQERNDEAQRAIRTLERLARLVEENPDPALRVYPDGRIQYKNPAAYELCGRWDSADPQRVPAAVAAVVSAAYDRTETIRHEVAFGAYTYLITAAPALPPANYVNVFASDITARKRAEEALRESEQRLALALSGTQVGMCYRDVATGETRCTEQFTRLLGLRPTTTTTTTTTTTLSRVYHYDDWAEHVHPEDLPRVEAQLRRCMSEHVPYEAEYRVLWPDGSVRWIAERGVYRYDADGRSTHMLGIFLDITERKRAEESLRQSERQFKSTFENAAMGIAHVALDGHILQFNNRFCEIAGYLPKDIWGKTCEEITFADDWTAEKEQLRRLLEGEVPHYSIEKRYVRADSSPVWVNLTRSVQRDEAGRPEYLINLVEDISERKQAEEALRELNATLDSKVAQRTAELRHRTGQLQKLTLDMSEAEDRERERLAQILHDDLQQELAAAKLHLSIVRSRIKHDSAVQEIAARVDEMLKDAIGKSRSLSHELSPAVLHQSDLAEILRWLANEMQDKHGLTVHVQGQGHCRSDPIKAFLYRTAQELLFNAVKHAQVSAARVRVRQCGGYLHLSVSDRGRGFDPGKLRETAGFGLLSIRERIELLGGHMKIRSAPGQGSTFFVVVPNGTISGAAVGVGPDAYPPHGSPGDKEGGYGGPPLRVLLADDHEVVRQGLASLLREEERVEVVGEATNGREAVDLAAQLHPDVVVMDVLMPVMSGEEATRRIKEELPQIRLVSLSMREEPEVRERMCAAGAQSYVLKTAPYKELLAAIRGESEAPCEARV